MDIRKKSRPVESVGLHHAVHVRSRKVAKRVTVIAAYVREVIERRLLRNRSDGESRNCREMRHGGRRMVIARVKGTVVHIRVVRWREGLDGEVRGSSGWERTGENVRDEVVRSQNDGEVKRVFLQKKMPADDLRCRNRLR